MSGSAWIDPKAFPALEAVLDVVYNPFRTELLLRAEDCGVTAAGGFEMLVAQAVFAAEHFTGRQLDTAALIPAVSRRLRHELANVSIIGDGRAAANPRWARRWPSGWASDLWIWTRKLNAAPGIIFPTSLPRRARLLSAAMRRKCWPRLPRTTARSSPAAAGSSKIRPTPGALRQNGPVLWVRRPLERLATGGRPLSKGGAALKQLEAERTPLYEAAATAVLENNSTLTEAVDKAVELFEADETL